MQPAIQSGGRERGRKFQQPLGPLQAGLYSPEEGVYRQLGENGPTSRSGNKGRAANQDKGSGDRTG